MEPKKDILSIYQNELAKQINKMLTINKEKKDNIKKEDVEYGTIFHFLSFPLFLKHV